MRKYLALLLAALSLTLAACDGNQSGGDVS